MSHSSDRQELKNLMLLLYLMPVFGVGPALWTLSQPERPKAERALSRMAIKLMMAWFAGTVMLDVGVENMEGLRLPLLIASSVLTSGYFVMNLGLMLRLWQGRTIDSASIPNSAQNTPMSAHCLQSITAA